MNLDEHIKAILGLIGIWTSWLIAHLSHIQTWASILASMGAFLASIVYAWYYIRKIRKEK